MPAEAEKGYKNNSQRGTDVPLAKAAPKVVY